MTLLDMSSPSLPSTAKKGTLDDWREVLVPGTRKRTQRVLDGNTSDPEGLDSEEVCAETQ